MRYLNGEDVADLMEGVIHAATQQHDYEVDLTASEVYQLTGAGSLDFGGSEYVAAPRAAIKALKRKKGDEYGWWDLEPGTYIVRFNETVALHSNHIAYIQPHERLLDAGAHHPTFYFRDERPNLEVLLTVGSGGLSIKENARLSKLLVLDIAD